MQYLWFYNSVYTCNSNQELGGHNDEGFCEILPVSLCSGSIYSKTIWVVFNWWLAVCWVWEYVFKSGVVDSIILNKDFTFAVEKALPFLIVC